MNHFRFFAIIGICSCVSLLLQFCFATDSIALNQSISDGETLVSPGQRFELGFFSPGRSKNRYLGIWYKTTPDIVVWVANRDNPLEDSHGIFTISSNGTPVLLNSSKISIWSANVSRFAASPVVYLLDMGNLVLIDNKSTNLSDYLWQSFNYPGDTFLPGALLGENKDTGMEQYLTSWRNNDDPSSGTFTFKLETHGFPQTAINLGMRKWYRTGLWDGLRPTGIPDLKRKIIKRESLIWDKGRMVAFSSSFSSDDLLSRFILNSTGYLQRYALDEKKNEWNLLFTLPNNECDKYQRCGPNGVCNSVKWPICQCLLGYTPKNQQEWDLFDWSGGCVRIEPPNCKNGDGFSSISKVKLPDMLQFQMKTNMSLSECEAECLRNCSCSAYTNPYIAAGENSCLMWYGDLVDLIEYQGDESEQNVNIRLPISQLESAGNSNMKKKRPFKVILITTTGSGVVFFVLVLGCIVLKLKRNGEELRRKDEDLELPLFDLSTIEAATRSFSHENMIGEGGFGHVYKGKLSSGQEVAVKRLSKNSVQGAEEFKNEVTLIAKLQHRNLVRLLGCCIQGEERMIIYEYLPNESLYHFIFDGHKSELLTWPKRFNIILGITRGLLYLHQDSRLKIIHRDLKTSNILLDWNLEPKISDFGLARIFGGDQIFVKTKRVIGTYGYMAPEYAIDGRFSDKSDVFSMGVLLLEIVSGKKNTHFSHTDHHHNLLGHAWILWSENRAMELMDENLENSFVESQVKRCIQIGLLCVQKFAEDRPTMSSVLFMLGNEGAILPQPKQPGFFIERSSNYTETHASESKMSNTSGMLTITQLEPR